MQAQGPIAAVIDIGSSSVRLVIAQRLPTGSIHFLHESRVPTRLAEGLDRSGIISDRAVRQTLAATVKMVASVRAHQASSLRIVATAAMRDAANARAVAALIENACQHPVEIISGADEAALGFRGALASFGPSSNLPTHIAIVDIGGGSTQLSLAHDQTLTAAGSVPIGAVRLNDLRQTLPGSDDRQRLSQHASASLAALPTPTTPPDLLIATGGTASALAMMHHQSSLAPHAASALKHDSRFARAQLIRAVRITPEVLDAIVDQLFSTPAAAIARQYHIQPDRAELLPAGAVILSALCQKLSRPTLAFTTGSIRDAILADLLHASVPASALATTPSECLPSTTPGG